MSGPLAPGRERVENPVRGTREMAGMQALLSGTSPVAAWRWGQFLLRPSQRQLLHGGEAVEVEDRVLDLLVLLLQHRERALDRQEVIVGIWGKRPVSDATLRQLVYRTRRAIGDDGEHQAAIATLYGRSLQWVAPVTEVFEEAGAAPAVPAEPQATASPPARRAGDPHGLAHDRRKLPDRRRAPAVSDTVRHALPGGTLEPARRGRGRKIRLASFVAALVLLAAGGAAAWLARHPARSGPDAIASPSRVIAGTGPSVQAATLAVLPFKDLDPQQDQRYLGDGLTDELINRLARVPDLRVTARTSSFALRDKAMDVRAAAQKLGVANVLEGSVQRSGKHLRVRVALVDARTGYERWAGEYDAGAGDLLGMEDRIAGSVVTTLYPRLASAARAHAGNAPPVAAAAHDFYMVGLQYLSRRTTADIDQAIAYFDRAIQADPGYADAWSGIATGYAILRDYDADAQPDAHWSDALGAARKAVMLDPESSRGHMVLGQLYEEHWDWSRARHEFELALELDPSDATAHQWYAIYFWFTGDMQSALKQMRIARELDPLSPIVNADLGRALLFAGDVAGAIEQGKAAVALWPRFALAHLFLAAALQAKGRYADALAEVEAAIALTPGPPASDDLAFLGQMQWFAGDHAAARRELATVEARARQHYVSGVSLASLEWPVGKRDRAFANLARAAADHDHLLMSVSGMRNEDWCGDPRFRKLLASMHLPPH